MISDSEDLHLLKSDTLADDEPHPIPAQVTRREHAPWNYTSSGILISHDAIQGFGLQNLRLSRPAWAKSPNH